MESLEHQGASWRLARSDCCSAPPQSGRRPTKRVPRRSRGAPASFATAHRASPPAKSFRAWPANMPSTSPSSCRLSRAGNAKAPPWPTWWPNSRPMKCWRWGVTTRRCRPRRPPPRSLNWPPWASTFTRTATNSAACPPVPAATDPTPKARPPCPAWPRSSRATSTPSSRSFNKRDRTNDNAVMHAVVEKMTELEMVAVAEYVSGK